MRVANVRPSGSVPKRQSEEDILATARERFRLAEDAESEIRREALDDLRFCAGEQWDSFDKNSRQSGANRRPCLTFNKLIGPLNMCANEVRTNQSGIQVHPVDSTADPDTAEIIEGMIRHIEYSSKADEVYETAIEQSAAGGFAYFRVTTRYCSAKSFDQELRIERIADPFSVYIDPYAREADKSDMHWAFECEWVPKDEYKQEYGESVISQMNFYEGSHNPAPGWIGDSGVRIARYWTAETVKRTLSLVEWPDGKRTPQYADDIPQELPEGLRLVEDEKGKPLERETEERIVKCYKINGIEILDETDWPGMWIPLLCVLGKEMYVEGERHLFSLVRFAKDAQKLYNFYRSSEAETVLLGTKAPWIGVKGAFKDPRWATANSQPWAFIEYEPTDIEGNPAPPPTRNIYEPPIQALSLGAAQASDDIKATTNIYDASLGAQGNETSGIAIRQRQSQAGLSNFHFVDNLNRAIRQCGVVLCDLIPKIYDTPREIRILGEDRAQQVVQVNQNFVNDQGMYDCYDLTSGKYDVTIKVGPSYTTQREETWSTLTDFARAYPPLLQMAGDIIFANGDFAGSDKIAERFRKMLPPGMIDPTPGKDGKIPPEAMQAQIMQMNQTIEQLTAELQKNAEEMRTNAIDNAYKERIESMKVASSNWQAALDAQVKVTTTEAQINANSQSKIVDLEAKLKSTEDLQLLQHQIAILQARLELMASGQAAEEEQTPGTPQNVM